MIGIFDSGFGGLTVLKACMELMPEYDYVYLGDTARVPYGTRAPETIRTFTEEAVGFFIKQKTPLTILACNTATANALRYIQQKFAPVGESPHRRILGVIRPIVEKAVMMTKNNRIAVVGTAGTISSGAYEREIAKLNPCIRVKGIAAPLLVPLVEEGWSKRPETRSILKTYLAPVKDFAPDTVILGCTHYPLIKRMFQDILGKRIRVIDTAEIVAASLRDYLARHPEIDRLLTKNGTRTFYVTDNITRFKAFAKAYLKQNIAVEKVSLRE